MTQPSLPEPIRAFIDSTNRGDSDAFIQSFTSDALLDDWGRQFTGHDGIAQWNTTDNIGVQAHFELVGVEPGPDPDSYIVTLAVSGNGHNGVGPMTFRLRNERTSELRIAPTT